MKLRKWQAECVESAIKYYKSSRHFLCLATPGAGKSTMAAEVSLRLLEAKLVDYVLCFSPSKSVANGLRITFSNRLKRRFDGLIGAVGCSYTYQSMLHLPRDFWDIFVHNRVLVVFDEIHHCAGKELGDANAWGEEILLNIQHKASYTLSLTGTPWRSDRSPIVTASYTDSDIQVLCNYTYGLKEAVRDGVCRKPKIVLVDNEHVELIWDKSDVQIFNDLSHLFRDSNIPYSSLISNEKAINYILSQACCKLGEIREHNPKAGGLVVAASVAHAQQIADILQNQFCQTVAVVTYKHAEAVSIINEFRYNDVKWIVSVGMISEGTDIPRLQVCCHLSSIRTELYFRQVLGRILRVNQCSYHDAWLYTFAEPTLVKYAERVDEELPDYGVLIRQPFSKVNIDEEIMVESIGKSFSRREIDKSEIDITLEENSHSELVSSKIFISEFDIELYGSFRERVISLFE